MEQFIKSVSLDWDKIDDESYIRHIDALCDLKTLHFSKPVTIFVGENGTGKSTLLEAIAIACGFNPEGGTKNYRFSTYDSHSKLCDALKISKSFQSMQWGYFLRAESFYNVATQEDIYLEGMGSLHTKSHGESFLEIANEHFRPNGLYLLDEPESALSPQMQLTLLSWIYDCARMGSQFIIVSHSPILLGIPDAEIISFDDGKIHPCDYQDTGSYKIMKLFIDDRERLLRQLLSDD